ncbi:hypothetical protein EV641_109219 [Rhodococcus sp. SMB37]|uniref:hypothetical protein n=1 Tax=Rhodococcus sp. SMB37 TaxID=2512213 RepID=UPI0010531D5B|nr:hypothetical protein [Rhodococcus sp. SMB37]TCN51828.1 hypothetical protein EV641_109219 [Rhodococcus sp. SMB37]
MSTTDRNELANLLDSHMSDRDYDQGCRLACGYSGDDRDEHLAAAILAAGWRKPRTITTVDELGTLPAGTIVVLEEGRAAVCEVRDPWLYVLQYDDDGQPIRFALHDTARFLPALVLWTPDVDR